MVHSISLERTYLPHGTKQIEFNFSSKVYPGPCKLYAFVFATQKGNEESKITVIYDQIMWLFAHQIHNPCKKENMVISIPLDFAFSNSSAEGSP